MKNKILPVIVLYGQELCDSETYKSLLSDFDGQVFVYDNSPKPQNVLLADGGCRCTYVHDASNGGISKAYNYAVSYALKNGFEWILFLDQDSHFANGAIAVYDSAISMNPAEVIFVPQIYYSEKKAFSPVELGFWNVKGKFVSIGSHLWSDYSVVNSGMCVNLNAYNSVGGYEDKVRLDFADYCFIEKIKKKYRSFYRVDVDAYQNFSNSENDIKKMKRRFDLYLESAMNVPSYGLKGKIRLVMYVLKHSLALFLRTFDFFFITRYFVKLIKCSDYGKS